MGLSAEVHRYRCRFARPLATAVGIFTHREGVVVVLRDGSRRGRGEAAPLPGFSLETVDEAEAALRAWARDPTQPPPVGPASARTAAEQAQLSLVHGRRLAEALGAEGPVRVPVNALVTGPDDAQDAVARGHHTLKLKVARSAADDDVQRVRAVRAAVGPSVRLRLDANRGWSPDVAIEVLQKLASLQLELVEEPCAGLDALAHVRRATRVPIGVDESLRSAADLDAVLAAEAADVAVVKPMLVGGLSDSVALLGRARRAGLQTLVTTALDAGLGRRAALAVAAAGRATLASGLDTGRWLTDDPFPGPVVRAGFAEEPR